MNAVKEERPEYEVVRSKRSTADIVLERDGRIVVRAPESVADEQIEKIVDSKLHWIYRNLAEWRDLNSTRILREYKSGEGFLYLGRSYRLKLVAEQAEPLLLKNGRFTLRRNLVETGDVELAKAAFREYYVARGLERISKRVEYFAPKVDAKPRGVKVKELGHRWASCSPLGELSFHWKCMMAPQTIIDYIIVHELCHFHHLDHTAAFWNEVDKVMPNYRERKEWLKVNGAGLDV
ncbi:SprT family zinc-dependent metalloprotease [Coraliomargarita sp. SDUM461004]|uniref:SprT family zinc-dependent metalloprotease n=1 Tax=Thalassobacterium sedimentorum TaxID=3041258 RepID=A0ABU1AL69_9BACT|nr:SprT family zinc-dependent metalloprotease [Coraliomargarita sp. SDUM461004]MDQ8195457.1 SprT family zinc-dependent metalloprotease [Coraliomargarita sp. SDUM461004]